MDGILQNSHLEDADLLREELELAAADGDLDAMAILGAIADREGDRAAALEWLRLPLEGDNSRALFLMGSFAIRDGDFEAARAYAIRALEAGHPEAEEMLEDVESAEIPGD